MDHRTRNINADCFQHDWESKMTKGMDVDALLEQLTLEEKISLLAGKDFWHTVPIPRLNIPSIRVSDGPNGIRGTKFFNAIPSNCFPCGTALAATFDKELLHIVGKMMGKEAIMKGAHVILGPTCNIVRSPLGGRDFESYSEDPVLSGHAASYIIQGIQSEKVLACIKHFVCNDLEDYRKGIDVLVTDRAVREIYLKPFQIALRNADPKALMTSYNKINGVHVAQSKKYLQDILRQEWGYKGMTMSDWFGTYSIKESLDAGLNLEMPGPTRFRQEVQTTHKVNCSEIHEDVITENARRLLEAIKIAQEIGIVKGAEEKENDSKAASQLLRKAGAESLVLLKNDGILPLPSKANSSTKKIAVIGPNAKTAQDSGGGSASMRTRYKVTPYEGLTTKLKAAGDSIEVKYALGATLDKTLPDVAPITSHAGKPGLLASFYKKAPGTGDREKFHELELETSKVFLADFNHELLDKNNLLYYVDIEGEFTPENSGVYEFGCSCLGTAQVFVNNKLVVDNKTKQEYGDAFFLGMGTREEIAEIELTGGETYAIRVEFGTSPTYTLPCVHKEAGGVFFGFREKVDPQSLIDRAVEIAKDSDVAVLFLGLSKEWESEGFDRPHMDIPGYTSQLVEQVCEVNKNVVVVNQSGSPVTMPWIDKIQGLVQAWYGGNELGNSIADVLFGDGNPSGKLSMTFPKAIEDNPSFVNFASAHGRVLYGEDVYVGYRWYEKTKREVLFPFGYGLSYSTFELSGLKVHVKKGTISVEVSVKNTGTLPGAETVQVYVQQEQSSVQRPVKELKDFCKVMLKKGETKKMTMSFSVREATSYWNEYKDKWCSEKGTYNVLVGNSSANTPLKSSFTTESTEYWLGL